LGVMLIVRRTGCDWTRARSCVPPGPARYRLLGNAARDGIYVLGSCLAAMVAVFTVHLLVCSHEVDAGSPAGSRDQQFLSAPYRDYLKGKRSLTPEVFLSAARDYGRFIHADFDGIPHADANGSTPITWLRGGGTINYRWDSAGDRTAYVQLVGNPASWLLALLAPCAVAGLLLWPHRSPASAAHPIRRSLMWMLLIEWLAFMVLHQYLSTLRVMYLYHYFIGLVLAFAMLPLVFEEVADRWPAFERRRDLLLGGLTAALLASFVFYSPLNFHRPLTRNDCQLRNVLHHVVNCR
jgi:dolichyl-phosphate-mannose-protein mannosyltransferase